ncbi:6-phosphogluconate dehydrogenase (decarboxylating) [Phytophthora nicotianae CJ01A1]|uniref:6-phosphogluconate dehydrogenase, decarboxylating n=7 Tax=Phytophthora nicotianae TaxID=4792 RepID=W2QAQ8_PHYN3|nr:6-phosphogluconate dehydrogenase (decarboxylating) [Phytophthora nicotianae INRA-310]ETI47388.1 6-phosphogluconate dehydrogenase (decarboxylating) [Phytophthora nicotianae P1569]ETK87326.1 6-phosphogluconate dehydrogenase (decarboxylating) [Phytophthora nicotianae]ETO76060.1 6-phosphogluconate dehydrogenase (decarboxylating) [Phytophthora nicotianae P1976]ETP17184.1 6-phosphogluconate dehydrogenase (decarboxylating) [Phytophthora nicotianae CJ01A1]ETP45211.1 6-phosphogluconate dehydrogenase
MADLSDIGLFGLAVMGQNFALNMASHGFKVSVCNRSPDKVDATVQRAKDEGNLPLVGYKDMKEFVASLARPRKVVILVVAGKPVDLTIAALSEFMEPGDIIIDGGNEWFPNSVRRASELEPKGIHFVGMGVSGGEEGARNGPSLMPGGPKEAYDALEPIITKCAAQVDDGACTTYLGPIGSGNYVKMVHNGIEYGDMQLIAEAYDILKIAGGLTNEELASVFDEWNKGELESFLIEITAQIFAKKDDLTDDGYVVDKILDKTGMKGTGRWTVQEAAERSIAAPTITASLDARYLSARKDERVFASKILSGPSEIPAVDKQQLIDDVRQALYASKICSYAQGLNLIREAGVQMGWNVDLGECARIWKGGCIIRAKFLDRIKSAYAKDASLISLLVDPDFAAELQARQYSWRRVVSLAVASGIPAPSFSGSLNYYDTFRRERLPANLTQAQRDFFGGHTYERTDREGLFHCAWSAAHHSIGDVSERIRGNL